MNTEKECGTNAPLNDQLVQLAPAAWDYYHKRLMSTAGETRHHVYWTASYIGRDGTLTGDLELLLDAARAGKPHVEASIWVRPMYYGDDVQRMIAAERERCANIARRRAAIAKQLGQTDSELTAASILEDIEGPNTGI